MKLRLENLSRSFREPVLKGINYEFESGKLYVIKGVSGCGKTTLLNILGGVDTSYEGELTWEGAEAAKGSYIFQKSLLLSGLTLRENFALLGGSARVIEELSEQLGIAALLDRLPEQFSGGERQRAAVVRALLHPSPLLLADEPTASLDGGNSASVAELIAGLRSPERILIVATHSTDFDPWADEIIHLDYGEIGLVEKGGAKITADLPVLRAEAKSRKSGAARRKTDLAYLKKRRPESFRLRALIPAAVLFLLILLGSAVQNNLTKEMVRFYSETHPMDTIYLEEEQAQELKAQYPKITVYEYYVASEGKRMAYYLMPEKDSVLGAEGMLEAGHFPQSPTEVLVTQTLAEAVTGSADYEAAVGKTFSFLGLELTIAGVNKKADAEFNSFFRSDIYYRSRMPAEVLFIPYETIQKLTDPIPFAMYAPYTYVMCVLPGISQNAALQQEIQEGEKGGLNAFYDIIKKRQQTADRYTLLAAGVVALLFVGACIFQISLVRTDLFYRKKELGYLQIFGMTKKRVLSLIAREYRLKLAGSLALAAGLTLLLMLVYGIVFGGFVPPNPLHAALIILLMIGIQELFVRATAGRFLRRSVRELIQ